MSKEQPVPTCPKCFDTVLEKTSLLLGRTWRILPDRLGRMQFHWTTDIEAICGEAILPPKDALTPAQPQN